MKGIIAEIHGSYMIVIAKNGDFIKCKKLPNCNIGDEVNIPAKNINTIYKKLTAVAASFIIFAMLSTGVYAYYTPYSYVSIDINPSLELSVNRFDKVIGVHAFNKDAEKVLSASSKIKNSRIETAIEQILETAEDQGYLKQGAENSIMIVISTNNEKEEAVLTSKISKTSTAALSKVSSTYEVILEKTGVEKYKEAKKGNISPGKVILANEFKEAKPEIDEEKIKQMPLQQVIKEIEKKDGQDKKDEKDSKDPKIETPKPAVKDDKSEVKVKPQVKDKAKENVKNVEQLIKEKNEELGKKLEQIKNKDKDKSKEDKESFNQEDGASEKQNEEKNDNKNENKDGQDSKPSKDNKKN